MADEKNNFDLKTVVEELNRAREHAARLQSVVTETPRKDPNSETTEVLFHEMIQSLNTAISALANKDRGSSAKSSKASGKKRGNSDP